MIIYDQTTFSAIKAGNFPSEVSVDVYSDPETKNNVLRFQYNTAIVTAGCGRHSKNKPWFTVYELNQSNATDDDSKYLLLELKTYFEKLGYDFGFSFAGTTRLKGLLYKLKIKERERGTGETFVLDRQYAAVNL